MLPVAAVGVRSKARPRGQQEGAVAGLPWTGSAGILEPTAEIMAREKLLQAPGPLKPDAVSTPSPQHPLRGPGLQYKSQNPDSPLVASWPSERSVLGLKSSEALRPSP